MPNNPRTPNQLSKFDLAADRLLKGGALVTASGWLMGKVGTSYLLFLDSLFFIPSIALAVIAAILFLAPIVGVNFVAARLFSDVVLSVGPQLLVRRLSGVIFPVNILIALSITASVAYIWLNQFN